MTSCVAGCQQGNGNPLFAAASMVSPLTAGQRPRCSRKYRDERVSPLCLPATGRKIAVLAAGGRNRGPLKFSGPGKTHSFRFNNLQKNPLKFSGPGISATDS